jgi:hypothetical protein
MMDMNTAANIAEIGGGIAILVSLIYAGFQIRQSNRIARVESIRSTQSNSFLDEYDMATIGRGLISFDSLNYADKWEFHCYCLRFLGHYGMVVQTHKLGLLGDISMDNWSQAIAETFATPGGQQYWEGSGRESFEPEYVKAIDDYIKNSSVEIVPYNQRHKWMLETA